MLISVFSINEDDIRMAMQMGDLNLSKYSIPKQM
jgi:hypothetical protein